MISPGSYDFHGGPNQNPGVGPSDVKKLYIRKYSTPLVTFDPLALDNTNADFAELAFTDIKNLPTTITDFRTGDVIPVDGPSGTAKMPKDDLLRVTAENAELLIPPIVSWGNDTIKDNLSFEKTLTYTDGIFDKLVGNTTYRTSDYIDIADKRGVYFVTNNPYNENLHLVEFYNSNQDLIGYLVGGIDNDLLGKMLKVEFPSNATYVRYSVPTASWDNYGIHTASFATLESQIFDIAVRKNLLSFLENNTSVTADNLELVTTTYTMGIFEKQTTNPLYETSDFIDISSTPSDYYFFTHDVFSAVFEVVRFYDKDKNIISKLDGGTADVVEKYFKVNVPSGCKYIKYARRTADSGDGLLRYKGTGVMAQTFDICVNKNAVNYFDREVNATKDDMSLISTTYTNCIFEKLVGNTSYQTSDFIDISASYDILFFVTNNAFNSSFDVFRFYDKDKNVISTMKGGTTDLLGNWFKVRIPSGCKYIRYARATSDSSAGLYSFNGKNFVSRVNEATAHVFTPNNYLVWCGTSIPTGATFPAHASAACGYNCINMSYGASALIWTNTHPSGQVTNTSGRKLTATVAELEAVFRQDVTNGDLTEEELEYWKDHSYERAIIPHIDGSAGVQQVSCVVIDHGFNDRIQIVSQLANEGAIDWESRDRSNYVGAFNYLIDKIMEANPFVKIIVGGYFQDTYAPYNSDKICYMEKLLAEKYNFPLLDVWKYSGMGGRFVAGSSDYISDYNTEYGTSWTKATTDANGNITFLQLFCPDNVHPHSDLTGNANRRLDAIYTKLLKNSL